MRRRAVITGIGTTLTVATAGCNSRTASSGTTGAETTQNPDTLRSAEIIDQRDVPDEIEASLIADVVESTVTSDHTATVHITFTNRGEKRDFTFGDFPPFTVTESTEDDPGTLLLGPKRDYEKSGRECWRPQSSNAGGYNANAKFVTLEQNESIKRKARIWGDSENDDQDICLPTGEFQFGREYEFGFLDEPSFRWGFTVALSAP
jgi:hypothetical protein